MPTLHETQRAMARSILAGADDALAPEIRSDGIAPGERLRVYRGNMTGALVGALRLSYPAIDNLVGAEFFEAAAWQFIRAEPPRTAWLYEYGGAFPAFLARFPAAASLAYLPDVARLEWAINEVLHAADERPLELSSLAALIDADEADVTFAPHPAVRLLHAACPADSIWRAVLQDDEEALGRIDLSDDTVFILLERGAAGVEVTRLGEAEARFTAALFAGVTLDAAAAQVPELDVASLLAGHFVRGRFISCTIAGYAEESPS